MHRIHSHIVYGGATCNNFKKNSNSFRRVRVLLKAHGVFGKIFAVCVVSKQTFRSRKIRNFTRRSKLDTIFIKTANQL